MKKTLIIIAVVGSIIALYVALSLPLLIDTIEKELKYEITSRQEVVCLISTRSYPSSYSGLSFDEKMDPENLKEKYPQEITLFKKLAASGYEDKVMHVLIPVMIEELSIDPGLELFMNGALTKEDKPFLDEWEKLAQNCQIGK